MRLSMTVAVNGNALPSLTNEPADVLSDRLVDGCLEVCDFAARHGMRMAFEPEPDMFVETMEQFERLSKRVNRPLFGLAPTGARIHVRGVNFQRLRGGVVVEHWTTIDTFGAREEIAAASDLGSRGPSPSRVG